LIAAAGHELPVERAPAKVNLTLRVLGRRADFYHDIESLVVFASEADRVEFVPGDELALTVRGPTASSAGADADNLVLKAARLLAAAVEPLRVGRFHLDKQLPVAAGLGGGSADAAAALRLLARHNGIAIDDPRVFAAARQTGADVPVCLDPRPRLMRGIGDVLTVPLPLPPLPAVLVNPGVAVATRDVFAGLGLAPGQARAAAQESVTIPREPADLLAFLAAHGNDLEPPAIAVQLVIAEVLARIRALPGCRLARMSGSGATCFGLFGNPDEAAAAARAVAAAHPAWWVRATMLG
jgi:4-diphosphocytidyl-2-C-methyl-D-erythritol kinase